MTTKSNHMIVALPDVVIFELPLGSTSIRGRITYAGLARRAGLSTVSRWEACQVFSRCQAKIEAEARDQFFSGRKSIALD
jgi:hypothetical protein